MTKETEPGDARKIEEIFQIAVDLAPEKREVFLHEHCDSSVLERVVKLLELHDRVDPLVADSPEKFELALAKALTTLFAEGAESNAEGAAPEVPRRLGDFEINGKLGRGGMGVVYEARQVSLNRKVALKVISSALGLSSKAVLRFRREAEAGGKLHHTNIVPIYATGEDHGIHYYAMELIDGPSLQQVIGNLRAAEKDDGPDVSHTAGEDSSGEHVGLSTVLRELPSWVSETFGGQADPGAGSSVSPSSLATSDSSSSLQSGARYFDSVARMIAEVADALDHAHENGVVHRDVKPANLLLSPDGRLSVNDFGLARMLEQPGMTMSGEFVGSPLYMSSTLR